MSQHTTGQTWGALRKAWKAYKVAKVQNDVARMKEYSERIKTLQKELGVPETAFSIPTEQVLIPAQPLPKPRNILHPIAFPCGCVIAIVIEPYGWHQGKQRIQMCADHDKECQELAQTLKSQPEEKME